MIRKLIDLGVDFDTWQPADESDRSRDLSAAMHESRRFPLYLPDRLQPHLRPVRGIAAEDRSQRDRPQLRYKPIAEALHRSVLDRWASDEGYRPPNLDYVMSVVEGDMLPVIDWDGSVMPPATVATTYPFVATRGGLAAGG